MVSFRDVDHALCTGTLIANRQIVTARHCVADNDGSLRQLDSASDDVTSVAWLTPKTGRTFRLQQGAYFPTDTRVDLAVIGIQGGSTPGRATIAIAPDGELPTPQNIRALRHASVEVVGFSPNWSKGTIPPVEGAVGSYRRQGTMEITGVEGRYRADGKNYYGFELAPVGGVTVCTGDSGGAVLRNGKLIGVISAGPGFDENGDCTAVGNVWAAFIDRAPIAASDTDRDGVINEADNCPYVANADQAQSDELDVVHGDACDPSVAIAPVVFLDPKSGVELGWNQPKYWPALGLMSDTVLTGGTQIPGDGAVVWGETTRDKLVQYRSTGYDGNTAGSTGTTHAIEPEYCACHSDTSTSGAVSQLSEPLCSAPAYCPAGGRYSDYDPINAKGWRPLTWKLRRPDGSWQVCPQYSSYGVCGQPVGNEGQPFARLYETPVASCSTGLEPGCRVGDYNRFWDTPGRTSIIAWDYTNEDYPHTGTFDRALTTEAWMRVRVYPKDIEKVEQGETRRANGFELPTQHLNHGVPYATLYRPLYDLRPFAWRVPAVFDAWRFRGENDHPDLALLAPIQTGTDIPDTYDWNVSGGPSRGLLLSRIDALTQRLGAVNTCQRSTLAGLATVGGALAQDGPWLFSFGGVDAGGEASAVLSVARLDSGAPVWSVANGDTLAPLASWRAAQGLADSSAGWEQLTSQLLGQGIASLDSAAPIADGLLLADLDKNRLAVFFGENAAGAPRPVAFRDLGNESWLTLETGSYLLRTDVAAAPSADGAKLYFYGGKSADGTALSGLYAVSLDPAVLVTTTESAARLDAGADPSPGARIGASLAADRHGRYLYLFGGEQQGERRADLWRYTIGSGTWELLADGGGSDAAPAMRAAALLVSKVDGSVLVVSGTRVEGLEDQRRVYRFRDGLWWTEGM